MPHYADGTEARVGDRVVGKDCCGAEIVGTVVGVMVAESCNIQVAHAGVLALDKSPWVQGATVMKSEGPKDPAKVIAVFPQISTASAKDFRKIG